MFQVFQNESGKVIRTGNRVQTWLFVKDKMVPFGNFLAEDAAKDFKEEKNWLINKAASFITNLIQLYS